MGTSNFKWPIFFLLFIFLLNLASQMSFANASEAETSSAPTSVSKAN